VELTTNGTKVQAAQALASPCTHQDICVELLELFRTKPTPEISTACIVPHPHPAPAQCQMHSNRKRHRTTSNGTFAQAAQALTSTTPQDIFVNHPLQLNSRQSTHSPQQHPIGTSRNARNIQRSTQLVFSPQNMGFGSQSTPLSTAHTLHFALRPPQSTTHSTRPKIIPHHYWLPAPALHPMSLTANSTLHPHSTQHSTHNIE
jgi:hypothetical protein